MNTPKNNPAQIFLAILFTLVTISPGISFAQTPSPSGNSVWPSVPSEYTLLEPLPCIPSGTVTCAEGELKTKVNFKEYVQYMFNLFIGIAAVSAVFMIVVGGFQYMTSDAYNKKSEGLSRATNAIYGLLLVLSSYLILKTIDPRLVEINETLVPPLQLTYNKGALNGVLNNLQDTVAKYGAQSAEATARMRAAEQKLEQYEQEKEELQAKINALQNGESLNDEFDDEFGEEAEPKSEIEILAELNNLNNQSIELQNKIELEASNAVVNEYDTIFKNFLQNQAQNGELKGPDGFWQTVTGNSANKQSYIRTLDLYISQAQSMYIEGKNELMKISNPPNQDALNTLTTSYNETLEKFQELKDAIK